MLDETMLDETIVRGIAYLDDGSPQLSAQLTPEDMVTLVKTAIHLELAKQGHSRDTQELCGRLDSLEVQMEAMMRTIARRQSLPAVQYVILSHQTDNVLVAVNRDVQGNEAALEAPRPSRLMIAFYFIGVALCVVFAALLALSGSGTNLIHPFLSLLGLVGGMGWLSTAWTDLFLWKKANLGNSERPPTKELAAIAPR